MRTANRNYDDMRELIASAGGRFISVEFVKADGSLRRMSVQPATLKYKLVGDAKSPEAAQRAESYRRNNPHLLPVWDNDKMSIRSINLDTVTKIAKDRKVYVYA